MVPHTLAPLLQVHKYVSTGLANSKFGIRNSKLQVKLRLQPM